MNLQPSKLALIEAYILAQVALYICKQKNETTSLLLWPNIPVETTSMLPCETLINNEPAAAAVRIIFAGSNLGDTGSGPDSCWNTGGSSPFRLSLEGPW
jgi:hypothetical protein